MMLLAPMEEAHVAALDPQPAQAHIPESERLVIAMTQAEYGPSWSALFEGEVMAIGGVCDSWEGRGICWAALSRHVGPHMLSLTRQVRRLIDGLPYNRLEMYVATESPEAERWAEILGFHRETPDPMLKFLPDGSSAYQYARTRP